MQSDAKGSQRTLDLTSSLEVGSGTSNTAGDASSSQSARSVLTIAFQFPFESSMQDNVANMAHQYVRSVISSVQRVAMAISPSGGGPALGPKLSPGSPEALTLAHWICKSYRYLLIAIFHWKRCSNLLCRARKRKSWGYNEGLWKFSEFSSVISRPLWIDDAVVLLISFKHHCFSLQLGTELIKSDSLEGDSLLKNLWNHQDAILCCSLKVHLTKVAYQ